MKRCFSILLFLFSVCLAVFSQGECRTRADQLFYSGKYATAIPALKECLNLQPNDTLLVQKMLAKSFFNIGYADSAYILYKKIVLYDPDDYDIQVFLGNYYYVRANNLAKIETVHEKKKTKSYRHRKNEEKSVQDTAIECYLQACQHLEKAYIIYDNEEIRKSLIDIYTIVGEKDKVAQYKKCAKIK